MTIVDRMQALIGERTPGHSLPQALYSDPAVLDFDIQAIFNRHWLQAGLEIEIPKVGDYITMTVGTSPIVILRNEEGGISAFFNSCRHRGAQICTEERGHAHRLVCPYHQWTYDLNGQLLRAGRMQESFDTKDYRLRPARVESVAGVIFVCLSEAAPDFAPIRAGIEPLLGPMTCAMARLPIQRRWSSAPIGNSSWKTHASATTVERGICSSCTPSAISRPRISTRNRSPGCVIFGRAARRAASRTGAVRGADFEAGRFALSDGVVSITVDGKSAVTKKLGAVGDGDVGTMWWAVQPNCFNHAVGDYAFLFQALPTGPQETVVTAKWIVHKDAVEGVDYDLARLTEVWNSTNNEDRWLAENNQRGVNSIAYVPGPYSEITEARVLRFADWYCAAARAFIAEQRMQQPAHPFPRARAAP